MRKTNFIPKSLRFANSEVIDNELVLRLENKSYMVIINIEIKDNKLFRVLEMFEFKKGSEFDSTCYIETDILSTICNTFEMFNSCDDYDNFKCLKRLTQKFLTK